MSGRWLPWVLDPRTHDHIWAQPGPDGIPIPPDLLAAQPMVRLCGCRPSPLDDTDRRWSVCDFHEGYDLALEQHAPDSRTAVIGSALTGSEPGGGNRSADRILWNRRPVNDDAGDIDEIVIRGAMVHVEQMNDRSWWIGIYKDGGADAPCWMGNFSADSRGRMRFTEQENDRVVWERDESHEDDAPEEEVG